MNTYSQEEIIKIASKAAAKEAIKAYEAKEAAKQVAAKDRRLHNIKLLLQNYRMFKKSSENAVYTAQQAEDALDVLALMWDPNNRGDLKIEAIKASLVRTKIMVAHIDTMLFLYRDMCYSAGDIAKQRRYDILIDCYVSDEKLKKAEILEKYYISERVLYYDLEKATTELAYMIFGMDYLTG